MTEKHRNTERDTESSTHQRAPFSEPLADGMDPTAPGAAHEPSGVDAPNRPNTGVAEGREHQHPHRTEMAKAERG